MANPSKDKGTRFEREVCEYLAANGHPHAERRAQRGVHDAGDVAGVPGFVVECKAEKRLDLAGYMDEVEVERRHADAAHGIAVVKRRGKPVGEAYVVTTLAQWCAQTGDFEEAAP